MGGNRRLLLLGVTLIAAIIAVMVVRSGNEAPARPPAGQARPAVPGAAAAVESGATPDVKLSALTEARSEPIDHGRNPFRFRPRPEPPPSAAARPVGAGGTSPSDLGGAGPVQPAGPPPPPPIALKFIGIVEKSDGTRWAVLTDGKRPIHGKEGDEIEGRYKILKIGSESLDIAYIDGRGRRTLPLNGQ